MGVSYYHCEACKESIYEEEIWECEECGSDMCTNCLDDSMSEDFDHDIHLCDSGDIKKEFCIFCSKKNISDKQIVNYCLKKLGKSKEEIIEDIKND